MRLTGLRKKQECRRLQAPDHKLGRAVGALAGLTTEHVAKSYQTLAFSTVKTKREIACEHALGGARPKGYSPKRGFSTSSGAGLGQPGRTAEPRLPSWQVNCGPAATQSCGLRAESVAGGTPRVERRGFLPQGSDWTFPWQLGRHGAFKASGCPYSLDQAWPPPSSGRGGGRSLPIEAPSLRSHGCGLVGAGSP